MGVIESKGDIVGRLGVGEEEAEKVTPAPAPAVRVPAAAVGVGVREKSAVLKGEMVGEEEEEVELL